MKTKNSPRRRLRLAWMGLALLAACLLASCEGGDVSLQGELAELRERVRRAEQERDRAMREKSREAEHHAGVEIQPVSTLQKKFEEAAKRFEQDVIATFPGYRPASIKHGKFAYVFDEQDPYRIPVELSLRPNSASALTPEVPQFSSRRAGRPTENGRCPGRPRCGKCRLRPPRAPRASPTPQDAPKNLPPLPSLPPPPNRPRDPTPES
jgi:hypothetical protein